MKPGMIVLRARELHRHRQRIANAAGVRVGVGRMTNPTLVHHGLISSARWHLITHEPPRRALADLYVGNRLEANRIARLFANMLGVQVAVLDNTDMPADLKRHPRSVTGPSNPRANPKRLNARGPRIVYNKLLGGWYVVVGPHQTPLNGRFNSKAEAQAWLAGSGRRANPKRRNPSRSKRAKASRAKQATTRRRLGRRVYRASLKAARRPAVPGNAAQALYYLQHKQVRSAMRKAGLRNPSRSKVARGRRKRSVLSHRQRRSLAKAGFQKSAQTRHLIIGQIQRGMKRGLPHGRRANPEGPKVTARIYRKLGVPGWSFEIKENGRTFGVGGPYTTTAAATRDIKRAAAIRGHSRIDEVVTDTRAANPKRRKPARRKAALSRSRRPFSGGRSRGTRRAASGRFVSRTSNPRTQLDKATAQFRKWQDREVQPRLERHRGPAPLREAAAELGQLVAVTYRSDKYDGHNKDHEHTFKPPLASLVTDPEGRDLHIVRAGSRYAITPDGIKN